MARRASSPIPETPAQDAAVDGVRDEGEALHAGARQAAARHGGAARPLVVKIGGAALDDPARAGLWDALAELHRRLDGQLVLVHGGGRAVDEHLARLGMQAQRRDGIRLTPPEQIDVVTAVLAGQVNKTIAGLLQARGVAAVGVCLGDGGALRTVRADRYGFDPGCVGRVEGGDGRLLRVLMDAGFLPVVSSIGLDEAGRALNVNADEAAAGVAQAVGAAGLVLLTDVAGILGDDGSRIGRATADEIEALIGRGVIAGGMIPKARAAVAAARAAKTPAIIASWSDPEALLGVVGGEVPGTMVVG